jgi:phage gp29-like protein
MAERPTFREYRELPTWTWSDWEKVELVRRAVRELELGQLSSAAQVVDAMGQDDRLRGCLLQRTEALPSLPFNMKEAPTGGRAAEAAELAQQRFEAMCSDEALTELGKWAVMLGIAVGQLTWTVGDDGLWWPSLQVWHPKHLHWQWDTRAWHLNTEQGVIRLTPGDGQWVVFAPYGLMRAWMAGAVRALYVPWLLRRWGQRDWARYSEVYGGPIRAVKTPAAAEEADKQRFVEEVAGIGNEAVLRLPTSPDATQSYDMQLIEAKSTGWESFDRLIKQAESSMAIALLGQNLSTEVKGGSLAAARVHAGIRNDVLEGDAQRLAKCLHEQVMRPWARFNFGDERAAPMPNWVTAPPEEKKEEGDSLKSLGDGISSLQKTGAQLDVDAVLEKHGVPVTGPAEEPPASEPPPGAGLSAAEALRAAKATGALRGQLYVDRVAAAAQEAGNRALRPDVQKVLLAVANSNDFDELKGRLVEAFGAMEPDAFADVLAKAMTLAELAGRLSVLEDLPAKP